MKKSLFIMLFVSMPFMMMAQEGGPISKIRNVWRTHTFNVEPGDITPGINEFTFAFSKEFDNFEPINVMAQYLYSPSDFKKKGNNNYENKRSQDIEFIYTIHDNPRYGYMSCSAQTQYDVAAQSCYWKRKNGNRLVAFYLVEEYEEPAESDRLLMFYDYDPAEDTMTPETALTEMVEKKMKKFDTWSVELPEKGKNIIIKGYKYNDDDSCETKEYTMKWDGQNFKF